MANGLILVELDGRQQYLSYNLPLLVINLTKVWEACHDHLPHGAQRAPCAIAGPGPVRGGREVSGRPVTLVCYGPESDSHVTSSRI